ncbi:MAG: PIN domain-containing protein [Candidatus Omnitrophica bacterium]|nr:PIN domain-containing protein [Candidatus Omnitrophota bacterium]
MRIYIDTSVINGLFIEDVDIKTATESFFEYARRSNSVLYSADLIVKEIERTPQELKRNKLERALAEYDVEFLPFSDEVEKIAHLYIREKVIPSKYLPDAVHIATASVHNISILVSWNFEHIVKLRTKIEINRINRQYGYPQINISSPREV